MIVKLREDKSVHIHGSDKACSGPTTLWLSTNVYSLDSKSRSRVYTKINSFCEAVNKRIGVKIRRAKSFVIPIFTEKNHIRMFEFLIMIEPHFAPGSEEIKKEIKAIAKKRKIQIKEGE